MRKIKYVLMDYKFISCDEFERIYLEKDFDKILVDENNYLINSYKYYIKYKNDYIKNTQEILSEYRNLLDELNHLIELEKIVISETKVIYTFIDQQKIQYIKNNLTKLLFNQKKAMGNLLNYIELLNKNKDKYNSTENENKDAFQIQEQKQIIQEQIDTIESFSVKSKRPPSIASIDSGKRPASIKSFDMEKRKPPSVKSLDLRSKTIRKALFSKK